MDKYQTHILIIDDEDLNLEIITEYLSDDYKTCTAEDGAIAWKCLKISQSHLTLSYWIG